MGCSVISSLLSVLAYPKVTVSSSQEEQTRPQGAVEVGRGHLLRAMGLSKCLMMPNPVLAWDLLIYLLSHFHPT